MELTDEMRAWIRSVVPGATDIREHRAMPWAVVASIETTAGRRWFKANHETFAYEAPLTQELHRLIPDHVLTTIAIEPSTHWFVMEDGGTPATDSHAHHVVDAYRSVQRAVVPQCDALVALGVPDLRPERLGDAFETALDATNDSHLARRLQATRPAAHAAIAALADDPRQTLVNSDMKIDHAFADSPVRLFDWGDAVITHPLLGAWALHRNFAHLGVSDDDLGLAGEPLAAEAARLAPLVGLSVWLRDPPGAREQWPDAIPRWLGRLTEGLEATSSIVP